MRPQAMHLTAFFLSLCPLAYAGYTCPSSASFQCCQALSGGTLSNCKSIRYPLFLLPAPMKISVGTACVLTKNFQASTGQRHPAAVVRTFIPLAAMAPAVVSHRIAPILVLVRFSILAHAQAVRRDTWSMM